MNNSVNPVNPDNLDNPDNIDNLDNLYNLDNPYNQIDYDCVICFEPKPLYQLCSNCKYMYCNICSEKVKYRCSICFRNKNYEDFDDIYFQNIVPMSYLYTITMTITMLIYIFGSIIFIYLIFYILCATFI